MAIIQADFKTDLRTMARQHLAEDWDPRFRAFPMTASFWHSSMRSVDAQPLGRLVP